MCTHWQLNNANCAQHTKLCVTSILYMLYIVHYYPGIHSQLHFVHFRVVIVLLFLKLNSIVIYHGASK